MTTVPFFAEDRLAELELEVERLVVEYVETGSLPAGVAPLTPDEARRRLADFWMEHRATLAESTVEFAFSLVRAELFAAEPESFAAALAGLSPGQLVDLAEIDAARAGALRREIIDRRSELLTSLQAGFGALVVLALRVALPIVIHGARGGRLTT